MGRMYFEVEEKEGEAGRRSDSPEAVVGIRGWKSVTGGSAPAIPPPASATESTLINRSELQFPPPSEEELTSYGCERTNSFRIVYGKCLALRKSPLQLKQLTFAKHLYVWHLL